MAGTGRDPVPFADGAGAKGAGAEGAGAEGAGAKGAGAEGTEAGPIAPHAFVLIEEPGPLAVGPSAADPFEVRAAPNPFRAFTSISFTASEPGPIRVSVSDLAGRTVAVLVDHVRPGERASITWNGASDDGISVPAGVYFARVDVGSATVARKIVLTAR